eukprot:m.74132 g.74132  ORF g.74132 m.74132 type:complete len:665 (+) comp12388_c0_seq2:269-2263(+)
MESEPLPFRVSVNAVKAFQSCVEGKDSFIQGILQQHPELDAEGASFVREVFEGCTRHAKAIKAIVNVYYTQDGGNALRADRYLYHVLFYLSTFRIDELGFEQLQAIILSQGRLKMLAFFQFLFNEESLKGWMKDMWYTVYAAEFVHKEIVEPALRHLDRMHELLHLLEHPEQQSAPTLDATQWSRSSLRSAGGSATLRRTQSQLETLNVTVPVPFNLTKPKPKKIPIPKPVEKTAHVVNPIPDSTYRSPLEMEALQRKKLANSRKARQRAEKASTDMFACAPTAEEVRAKHEERAQRKVQEQDAQLKSTPKARAVPDVVKATNILPIKMNTAAILREDRLFRKQKEEEAAMLAAIEAGQHNEFLLQEAEAQRLEELELERLAEIERRVLEGQLSREMALIAKAETQQQRQEMVMQSKEEFQSMLLRKQREWEREQEERKAHVEKTIQDREQAGLAKEKVVEEKKELRNQVRIEGEELRKRAAAEAAAEHEKRMEIIREIRALEATKIERDAGFDASETVGHGLLSEMSLEELRMRVAMIKEIQAEEEKMRREVIFNAKAAKDTLLKEKEQAIQLRRVEASQTRKAAARAKATATAKRQQAVAGDKRVSELREKLAAKRAERLAASTKSYSPSRTASPKVTSRKSRAGTATSVASARKAVPTSTR